MTRSGLNILVVCRSFPAHRAGGMEWHAHDLTEGLAAAGNTVHVLTTPLPEKPALAPIATNGRVYEIGAGETHGKYSLAFFRNLANQAEEISRIAKIDIIHAQGIAGIPLAKAQRRLPPVITTVHGTLFSETPLHPLIRRARTTPQHIADLWRYKHRLAFIPAWRGFLARNPRIIVDSQFTRTELRRERPGLDPAVVPLGINLERYPLPEDTTPAPARDHLEFFAAGRLEPIKGFAFLLNALADTQTTRPWQLTIAGDGPDRERLQRIASESPVRDRVHFTGRIPHDELIAHYYRADLFINPDQGQPAFGLANAEALVMGAPVLASDTGAHNEVVTAPEDGWLAPAHDPRAWPPLIQRITAQLPETTQTRQQRLQNARQRFSRETMIEKVMVKYREAVEY